MAAPSITRITSKDLVVEFIRGHTVATHVQTMTFDAGVSSGTFKINVNGEISGAITWDSVDATLISNINTALNAMTILADGELVCSGADPTYTLTGTAGKANFWFDLSIADDSLSGGNVAMNAVTTQGTGVLTLNGEMSSLSYGLTHESTDASDINADSRIHLPTVADGTFEINLYEAVEDWRYIIREGVEGQLSVYEAGKGSGLRYFVWNVMFLEVSNTMNQFEKVEVDLSGRRQGDAVVPVGSYQA